MKRKPWIPSKRPGECADVARMSKKGKVKAEDVKVKAEVKDGR